ncbi:hypothetical protein [Entomomonas asaccharolytica]|uniref:Uncharacterized protein n=1 Tax=Entomomonas asaccharolytica TaxID=2785331 RepID=A0A974NEH5_9GAMM|nr:hypothetical protein [Entomomonas asaccharolytica]QQP85043.1 hypothetical protein JHT90_11700 [Entomomonas asaccharolytica]
MSSNNQPSKTHFRKAFKSPYLSSADIVEPIVLTIKYVKLELDKTKKTKEAFNTAYFVEKEIRVGEPLKPMILNVSNSKVMRQLTGSSFLEDWQDVKVTIYVDTNVKFGRDTVEGLRISPFSSEKVKLLPEHTIQWENAKKSYKKNGNLDKVLAKVSMSQEHQAQLIEECSYEMA